MALDVGSSTEVKELKQALKDVLVSKTEDAALQAAVRVDAFAHQWLPAVATGDVQVRISGGPTFLDATTLENLFELPMDWHDQSARKAASIVHHFDGFNVGGAHFRVEVNLPEGTVLPAVARAKRGRARPRGRSPWLPFLDEEGRVSATPETIAREHGAMLAGWGQHVVDPFCGAGGSAIGAALSGCTVSASDVSASKVRLAQQNAEHFGVSERIDFSVCDVHDALSRHDYSTVALFLDPPWGGVNWERQGANYSALFGSWPGILDAVSSADSVLLKLPRTFDVRSLPLRTPTWNFRINVVSYEDHPTERIRLLTAFSPHT